MDLINALKSIREKLTTINEKLAMTIAINTIVSGINPTGNSEDTELDVKAAIETIQIAMSGSIKDELFVEISQESDVLIHYGDQFRLVVQPAQFKEALDACIFISGLEVN